MSQNATAETRVSKQPGKSQRGFTLIEVMIAIVIMTVGILALMATFGTAIAATESAQLDLIARHKALDAMESIYTARNSQQVPFASLQNQANGGIFLGGPQPLICAGNDGLVGTGDDVPCTVQTNGGGAVCPNGVECLILPGADGVLGTADDITQSLGNFTRTIAFNTVNLPAAQGGGPNTNLIAVTITVAYTKAGWPARTYTVNGLISSYH
jgi:prepilin-type N-terminal cleavage/methylation domain-containing protein